MKVIETVNPRKEALEREQSYQYWRKYDNGWVISIVCREGLHGSDEGWFEMAIWNTEMPEYEEIVIVTQSADFFEIADMLSDFSENPDKFYEEKSGIVRGGAHKAGLDQDELHAPKPRRRRR